MSTKFGDIEPIDDLYTYCDNDWSIVGLWKGPEGYYLGTDSGCSCNRAWEYYDNVDDLTGPLTAEQAREEIESLVTSTGGYCGPTDEELADFLAMVK